MLGRHQVDIVASDIFQVQHDGCQLLIFRRLAAAFLPHQVVEQYALEFLASIKALEEKYADLHHEH